MKLQKIVLSGALILGIAAGGVTIAQNAAAVRHRNLDDAQELVNKAYERISAAQDAHEFDMDGHAAKAKELLREAGDEIRKANRAADRH